MADTTTDVMKGDERIITTTTNKKGKIKKKKIEIFDEKDRDPKAQPPLIKTIEEEFDGDHDQIEKRITTTYKDGLNQTKDTQIIQEYYTDPTDIKRETRSRWVGGAWKKESDYDYDRKGKATPH
jgi:hypothetical protein